MGPDLLSRTRSGTAAPGPALGPSVDELRSLYRSGARTPTDICTDVLDRIEARGADGVWISVADRTSVLARCAELGDVPADGRDKPLWGIPFGVKDSIDIAGWPTTLACPGYAYEAVETAPVVQLLLDAGAVLIGKTNLDQFATGLNGTRTPYPIPRSVFGDDLISGGSSSGSALAVALGEVPFAVATDTAGSGRVPAALNGVPGFKPSRGLISAIGLVPACRSLDCISLIAGNVDDLVTLFDVVAQPDARDPWSRPRLRLPAGARGSGDPGDKTDRVGLPGVRIGLPPVDHLDFFGDDEMSAAHQAAREVIGASYVTAEVSLRPFLDAGELLYAGPWVAERWVEFGDFLTAQPDAVLPVIAQIIGGGERFTAADVFRAQYRLAELKAAAALAFASVDVLVLPTIGTTFTVAEVQADPISTNTVLGHYTHFGNLLDLCAAAVPAGTTADGRPVSVMVIGPALSDDLVLAVAAQVQSLLSAT